MPFYNIQVMEPQINRSRFLLPAVGAMILLTWVMQGVGAPLTTSAAPRGIISFELAGSPQAAERILSSWSEPARLSAALSLSLDFLYIPVYATALSLACLGASAFFRRYSGVGASLGVIAAWGMWAAGAADVIENIALIRALFGDLSTAGMKVAWWCASVKFAWIFLALSVSLAALLLALLRALTRMFRRS